MKQVIFIFIIAIVIAVVIYLYRQPRVKLDKIDWVNKTINYTMSINGEKRSGVHSLDDSTITKIGTKNGKNIFWIKSLYNAGLIEIGILDGKSNPNVKVSSEPVIIGHLIDIKNKSVTPLVKITTNDFK